MWNGFKTAFLMSALMGLCLGVGYLLGGVHALLPALLLGGAMNLLAYFFSDKIGRELALRPEMTPTLARMIWRPASLRASARTGTL